MIGAFVIVTFLPLRLFILIALTYKFYKGQNWHNKRMRHNREVSKIELKYLFEDLKIQFEFKEDEEGLEYQWEKIFNPSLSKNNK
jgi:hypothetical protein